MGLKNPQIRPWQGASGLWYLQVISKNGKLVFDGGQGYSTKSNALRAARRSQQIAAEAEIVPVPLKEGEVYPPN